MPLFIADIGVEHTILKISGNEQIKSRLENLGFVQGSKVIIISKNSGNLIVSVKGSRVALDKQLAGKILI